MLSYLSAKDRLPRRNAERYYTGPAVRLATVFP